MIPLASRLIYSVISSYSARTAADEPAEPRLLPAPSCLYINLHHASCGTETYGTTVLLVPVQVYTVKYYV